MTAILLETPINARPEVCYKLSLSVDLHQHSTKKTKEYIIGGVERGVMKLGESVTWKAKHFGIWQTLTTKITAEDPYHSFIDEMTQGAFESMKHEHYFHETDYGTLMKDVFRFRSPTGFIGKFFNFVFLENYMRKFLQERNQIIKEVAESGTYQSFI